MLALTLALGTLVAAAAPAAVADRPDDFVYLAAVAPTIEQDMRYATVHNFTGGVVPGYRAAECLLTRPTALALAEAQRELNLFGLGLKVYDCYRPERAVRYFSSWAREAQDATMAAEFFPNINKAQLHGKGYIAHRSGHSRGSTVDVTLVPYPAVPSAIFRPGQKLQACTQAKPLRFGDNSLDMGTGYDCLDALAHTECPLVGPEPRRNRLLLRQTMRRYGLINYAKEWWHFTYYKEPHRTETFDFTIEPQPGSQ